MRGAGRDLAFTPVSPPHHSDKGRPLFNLCLLRDIPPYALRAEERPLDTNMAILSPVVGEIQTSGVPAYSTGPVAREEHQISVKVHTSFIAK